MFELNISVDNEAFQDDKRGEIARILEDLAQKIREAKEPTFLFDYNGNRCGKINWNI